MVLKIPESLHHKHPHTDFFTALFLFVRSQRPSFISCKHMCVRNMLLTDFRAFIFADIPPHVKKSLESV